MIVVGEKMPRQLVVSMDLSLAETNDRKPVWWHGEGFLGVKLISE